MAYITAVNSDMRNEELESARTSAAPPVDEATTVSWDCPLVLVMTVVFGAIVVGAVIVVAGIVETTEVFPETVVRTVDAGITVGAVKTVPGIVVVMITMEPSLEAGMALPTPVPVHCGGIDKVAVFGLAVTLSAKISPDSPLALVYFPLIKFAFDPSLALYSPVLIVPYDPSARMKFVVNLS
jgi:hypothetical protein